MILKFSAILIISLTLGRVWSRKDYDRNIFEKKYPGFGKEWITMGRNEDGSYIIGYLEEPKGERAVVFTPEPKDGVHFHLFTRDYSREGKIYKEFHEVDEILDNTKPTKFIIHGWTAKSIMPRNINLKDSLLRKYDANVFLVDWFKIGGTRIYPIARRATKGVGEYIGEFVTHIIHDLGVDAKKIHIIGHSLGAHVAGFTGRNVKNAKIGRITGLDPAFPGFETKLTGRLNKTDADFVDVIHTCSGFLGIPWSLGHADFYPNSGYPPQPNCGIELTNSEFCSHGKSFTFYTASVNNPNIYPSVKCDSWKRFEKNKCKGKLIFMGESVSNDARGDFYLHTDVNKPKFVDQLKNWAKNG